MGLTRRQHNIQQVSEDLLARNGACDFTMVQDLATGQQSNSEVRCWQ
jgi:hypothetical protein